MDRKLIVLDLEADNLLNNVTKIHCIAYKVMGEEKINTISNYSLIKDFIDENKDAYWIGHNLKMYDLPVLEKILKINCSELKVIDTLGLSWVVSPDRLKHGLESYGVDFGVPKPVISDWENQTLQDYLHRCSEDVKINTKVWEYQFWYLKKLYDDVEDDLFKYIDYISFKLDCVREHQKLGVKLDVKLCEDSLAALEALKEEKTTNLSNSMPLIPIKSKKSMPKAMKKANGEFSAAALKWFEILREQGLPDTHTEDVEHISGYKSPNPNSHSQIKDWLFSLGWEPEHFKYVKEEDQREMRKIPQVASKDEVGEICASIKKLIPLEPALEDLDGLSVISHRISVFKGFLRDAKNDRIHQDIGGLTNTLRLQHRGIVNLPSISKPYSENIRASLIADEGNIMVGCDLSGIEDNTKRHYIYQYDPKYVEEMNVDGYDPHLELGMLAGFLTQEEVNFYKNYKKGEDDANEYHRIKDVRQKSKTANFACTYKVGAGTLSRNSGLPVKKAQKLIDIYWERNKAILEVEDSLQIKYVNNQKWLQNPISKFWYSLRADKDKFSTLNQGSAVYVFDRWVYYVRKQGIPINFQIHDEWSSNLKGSQKDIYIEKINKAIDQVNEELQLNVKIGCSIDFGLKYSECH